MKKNNTSHKTYLKSLGKTRKDLSIEELRLYKKLQWRDWYRSNRAIDHSGKPHIEYRESPGKRFKDMLPAEKKRYLQLHYQYKKDLYKEKYYSDLEHRINCWFGRTSRRLGDDGSFKEVVGCSVDEFKVYVESLFSEGMSWDNWGTGKGKTRWHIDHISSVKQGGSNHYTNIQPLWSYDNIIKSKSD